MPLTLEERVAQLEREVQRLAGRQVSSEEAAPWWKKLVGIYKDDPEFEEAMRLGRAYRESLRPDKSSEDAAA